MNSASYSCRLPKTVTSSLACRMRRSRRSLLHPARLRMVGLGSLEEAKRTALKDFFFPEDQAFIMDEFLIRVLREGRDEVEIRFRHFATGDALWMHYSVFSLTDLSGRLSGFATVSRNITDYKKAQQQLIEVQQRLQAVMTPPPSASVTPMIPVANALPETRPSCRSSK